MNRSELESYTSVTDAEIVDRVRRGEPHLFEVVMRRHNQRLYRTARAVLRSESDAEDVMQDSYVSAFHHLDQFEGRSSFSTWLTRIAVNCALARRRRQLQRDALETNPSAEGEGMSVRPPASPEQEASDRELCAAIERAIDQLPEDFRSVFVLRAVEGLSVAETSECLGVSEETIKTRLHRARARIQESLLGRTEKATPRAFEFHLSRCDRVVAGVLARIHPNRQGSESGLALN